jgi:hypothetical protein
MISFLVLGGVAWSVVVLFVEVTIITHRHGTGTRGGEGPPISLTAAIYIVWWRRCWYKSIFQLGECLTIKFHFLELVHSYSQQAHRLFFQDGGDGVFKSLQSLGDVVWHGHIIGVLVLVPGEG